MKYTSLYCSYYQAQVQRELCWFFTAALRSYEHLAFDRTLDPVTSLFEFFVAPGREKQFLQIIDYFEKQGLITNFVQLPNRLQGLNQEV